MQVGHHLSAALTRTNISLSPSSFAAGNDLSRFCSAAPLAHFFFGSIGLHFLTQVGAEGKKKKCATVLGTRECALGCGAAGGIGLQPPQSNVRKRGSKMGREGE